jgi:hypothetical protein
MSAPHSRARPASREYDENEEEDDSSSASSIESSEEDTVTLGEDGSVLSLDSDEVKLQQAKKLNSKLANRFQGLKSREEIAKEHAMKRMEEGLQDLLALHSPSELSSVCGVLKLKSLERAYSSTDQIIQFVKAGKRGNVTVISEAKLRVILDALWEGAIHEYIVSTGHPHLSLRQDPRKFLMKMWIDGGFIDENRTFVPFYINREIQKRNDWVTQPDIVEKLNILRDMQENCKKAERDIVEEHDYKNILVFSFI